MQPKLIGLVAGLWLGFIWVIWSFGDMVLVGLLGVLGYLIGQAISGELDVASIWQRVSTNK